MPRIDTHHHFVAPFYRSSLHEAGVEDAIGAALPEWSVDSALETMAALDIATAILSVSTPAATFLTDPAAAAALARELNDFAADLAVSRPDRFGFFATIPTPHLEESVREVIRSLDELSADGVVLLANAMGTYLGAEGHDALFAALDERSAVVFVHPTDLPGPRVPGIAPYVADVLLDTTRAAYLLVCNGIRSRYPHIRFILSHAGGFVPYAAHRLVGSMVGEAGRDPQQCFDELSGFYFDTAVSSTASALPSLLAFAKPGHVTFGSDWPFASLPAAQYFAQGLESYPGLDQDGRDAIDRTNALALFPRLRSTPARRPASDAALG
ncbi:amidohydrolase [Rhodococcus sp. WMMA185]|uniref:amidohydrolase family protein n=1 Tax=Rhodococcus sp. WMMA185 TaxID=679318 RepID=UPI000878615D|nr:amidohydrolase family protein [Rhodococcus sp. WMMA185]AOW94039.1 amidohydrolase [Rhodococcus sp. WMMA185]